MCVRWESDGSRMAHLRVATPLQARPPAQPRPVPGLGAPLSPETARAQQCSGLVEPAPHPSAHTRAIQPTWARRGVACVSPEGLQEAGCGRHLPPSSVGGTHPLALWEALIPAWRNLVCPMPCDMVRDGQRVVASACHGPVPQHLGREVPGPAGTPWC